MDLRNIAISDLTWVASSSSSAQTNTARAVPTPPSTPSVSRTYNYSLYSRPTTPQRCPTPCLLRPTFSASCSQPRITASRGNRLDMAAPATPRSVQWRPCIAEWHTYDATAPPVRRLSQVSRKATSGNRSKGTTSRPPSEPSHNQQSCSRPRWDNLPSGHQRYPLKGLNLGYMYWGQEHSTE